MLNDIKIVIFIMSHESSCSTVYRILGSAEIFLQHGPYGFRSCQLIF